MLSRRRTISFNLRSRVNRILDPPSEGQSSSKCQGCYRICDWSLFVGKTTVTKSRPKFNVAALLEEEDKTEDGRALVFGYVIMITDRIYMFDML